jgi:formylglycine-generating enzyme required for sulfatase activity
MTPAYAAPEFRNKEVSAHSDQYSLAVSYCQLRGGRLPFTGDTAQIMMGHLLHPPDLTMLPAAERPAVARALAKKPEDRWPSCRAFALAVAAAEADDADTAPQPSSVWAAPTVTRRGRRPRRLRPAAAVVGALLLLTAVLPVALVWSGVLPGKPGGADAPGHADHNPPPQQDKDKAPPPPAQDKDKVAATPPDEFTSTLGMSLKRIEAGTFTMGSPDGEEGRYGNEGPQHEVTITQPFYLGAYPVTKGQFAAFVKDASYKTEAETDGKGGWGYNAATRKIEERDSKYTWREPGWEQTDDHPVVNVTWNDAREFCQWLSKKEGRVYELPTEAEWEYACRAGTATRFWCGDQDDDLQGNANVADASLKAKLDADRYQRVVFQPWDDGYPFTSPVGKFKPNPWGLYDMHGNVWQWCADWSGKYESGSFKDPKGPDSGEIRVLRGGAWALSPRFCRSAYRRGRTRLALPLLDTGFRVVLRPPARTP